MKHDNEYTVSYQRLLALYKARRFRQAYELVNELLARYSDSAQLLVRRAMIVQLLDDEVPPLESSMQDLQLAIKLAPKEIEPYIEAGYYEYAINDNAMDALPYFDKARQNASKFNSNAGIKDALIGLIKCYADLEDAEKTHQFMTQAKQLFPEDEEIEIFALELED